MKLVLVEWVDPCSTSSPIWQHKEEIDNLIMVPCITVGLLLKDTDEDIRLVMSLNPDLFSQAITIPKSSIKRIRTLKVG